MLQALLKGKLSREQENMEDILTSNVFGLLKYVRPREGILNYLSLAEDGDGERPLQFLSSLSEVPHDSIEYEFWPWWEEANCYGCEPDVVIKLKVPAKQDLLILIEAKYLSGKSSEADEVDDTPTDQLAKEWDNLRVKANRSDKRPVLIYLTAHYAYPIRDINDAISEFLEKRPDDATPVICWLSWRHLHTVCESTQLPILNDIKLLLDRLGLTFFDGVALDYVNVPWSFEVVFDWRAVSGIQKINWRFKT